MQRIRARTLLVGSVAAIAVTAGVGFAAIPSSSGAVNGCYEKVTGILRVIDTDAGKSCKSFESPITWSVQGPAGAIGPAGPQGESGPQGEKGDAGPAGPAGAEGPVGPVGSAGPAGPEGPQGLQGPQGPKGDSGAAGPRGPSDTYVFRSSGTIPVLTNARTKIAELDLPAGKYLLTANASFQSSDSEARPINVVCDLPTNAPGGNAGLAATSSSPDIYTLSSLMLLGAVSSNLAIHVEVVCTASAGLGGPDPKAFRPFGVTLTALKVETIH